MIPDIWQVPEEALSADGARAVPLRREGDANASVSSPPFDRSAGVGQPETILR
jgi:hypothetical protein